MGGGATVAGGTDVGPVGGAVGSISKNRSSHHNMRIQNSFCESHTWRLLS